MEPNEEIKAMIDGINSNTDNILDETPEGATYGSEGEERQEETAKAEGREEAEVAGTESDDEEEELTPEERYQQLLELYNQQSANNLELQARLGMPQQTQSQPAAVMHQPTQTLQHGATAGIEDFKLNEELITRALIEDDADAMKEVITGLVSYVKQIADPQRMRETLLLDMPAVARSIADQRFTMLMAVKEFYDDNQDLKPYMPVVGSVVNDIVAKDPQLTLAEVLERTEKEARRRLGIRKSINATDVAANRGKPAFAKSSSTRRPGAPKLDGIKEDIRAMMEAGR